MNLSAIQINPVTNQQEFEKACVVIDTLVDADLITDPQERKKALDLLEAIAILAHEYEKKNFAIPKPDPIEAIKERMEQLSLSRKDVASYFGGENRVSEVLNRKRSLTIRMARALHTYLKIPAETLLRASETIDSRNSIRKEPLAYELGGLEGSLVREPEHRDSNTFEKKDK